ncbi:hypothetical protein AB0M44_49600 [Streptosporangium subroseum]
MPRRSEQPYASGSALIVEHDDARLDFDGATYRLTKTTTDPHR